MPLLQHAMRTVRRRHQRGQTISELQAHIDQLPLSDEEKALLWLYAWVGADPQTVRRELDYRLTVAAD